MEQWTCKQLYDEYGLGEDTQAFTGHAMALWRDDEYLSQPASLTANAIQLYVESLEQYGKSPYIYPLYGLGGLPEGFSRLCAIHGGTFMLNKGVDEILTGPDGKAWGIKTGNEVARAKIFIGDASYFSREKSRVTGQVCIRSRFLYQTNKILLYILVFPTTINHILFVFSFFNFICPSMYSYGFIRPTPHRRFS